MSPTEVNALGVMLAGLRSPDEDVTIVNVAAHGPDHDMPDGCVGATVWINGATGTARAKYLFDAISLARGIARRAIAAREEKAAKDREAATLTRTQEQEA